MKRNREDFTGTGASAVVVGATPALSSSQPSSIQKLTFAASPSDDEALIAALFHSSPSSRLRAAAEILADTHGPAVAVRLDAAVRKQLKAETEPMVHEALIRAAGALAAHPFVSAVATAELLLALCTPASLAALERLLHVKQVPLPSQSSAPMVRQLLHAKPKMRAAAVQLLSLQVSQRELVAVLLACTTDPSPIVRLAALNALANLDPASLDLTEAYGKAAALLLDRDSSVRAAATRLVWLLCCLHPNAQVPGALAASVSGTFPSSSSSSTQLVRQVDETFVRLCAQLADTDKALRRLACQLLGSLSSAHPTLLLQTFSKQLLNLMRPASSVGMRAMHLGVMEGPGEGADWDANEDVSLLDAGAAGAFVHGMEDEYVEVRSATVDAVCELAVRRPDTIGAKAAEVLADAVHDEIDALRLNALHSLRKIAAAAPQAATALAAEQLHTLLSLAGDALMPIRHATYRLVAHLRLGSIAALRAALHTLQGALTRHGLSGSGDTDVILASLAALGGAHAAQAELMVEDELQLDRRFLIQEARPDDPAYVALLVFFAAAAAHNASLAPLLPAFARRHYEYLRTKHPRLLPALSSSAASTQGAGSVAPSLPSDLVSRLLFVPLASAASAAQPQPSHLSALLSRACREASETAEAEGERGGWCAFALLVGSALLRPYILQRSGTRVAEEMLGATYRLEHAFAGLSLALRLWLRTWRVYAHVLYVRAAPSGTAMLRSPLGAKGGATEMLVEMVAHTVNFATHSSLPIPQPLASLHALLQQGNSSAITTPLDALLSAPAVQSYTPPIALPTTVQHLRRTHATLRVRGLRGDGQAAERPVHLSAGVMTTLQVEAHITWLGSVPDGLLLALGTDVLPLPASSVQPHGPQSLRVSASLRVAAVRAWTEPAPVTLLLAKRFTPDLPSHPSFVPLSAPSHLHLSVRP